VMDALSHFSPKSVRYNRTRFKNQNDNIALPGESVPWCEPYGIYWESGILPSRTLEYAAGMYYIQEASAMLAISAASQVIDFKGKKVLDLAAAPGGKATQAAELIEDGYLVANEVTRSRLDSLVWNINRHRLNNVIVTSLQTGFLAKHLPGFFDIVVVDAPCSGEGLFQKRKHSLDEWSEKNVRFCALRQETILEDAVRLLRPGGYIVYSTCTFAREENEEQVELLFKKGMIPIPLPPLLKVSPAISTDENVLACSRRIFPHREKGAGAFVSILQKPSLSLSGQDSSSGSSNSESELKYVYPKTTRIGFPLPFPVRDEPGGFFFEKNGIISYFSYERIPAVIVNEAFQVGAPLIDKRRGNSIMYGCVQLVRDEAVIDIPQEIAERYIHGENLDSSLIHSVDGIYFIGSKGLILGAVNISGTQAVNHFPRPLAINTGR